MAWRRQGDKPLSEPMMVRSLTHICVTRPQWVRHHLRNQYPIQTDIHSRQKPHHHKLFACRAVTRVQCLFCQLPFNTHYTVFILKYICVDPMKTSIFKSVWENNLFFNFNIHRLIRKIIRKNNKDIPGYNECRHTIIIINCMNIHGRMEG